jgi:periplasmic protein TonB
VTRPSWLWISVAASTAAHAAFAWQLSGTPRERRAPRDRDAFEVRMVALPPPEPPAPEPPPEPPAPEPPPPAPPPKPVLKAPPPPAAAEPPAPEPAPAEPAPEPTTAPAALLAETGIGAGAGIVQLAGAPIGAVSSAAPPPVLEAPRVTALPARASAPLAKLSDLSRKPKAPALDAALRQNYPAELRRRGTEGQAEVRVVIDPRGGVGEIAIVSESAAGFADACRKTLIGSRWSEPLDREGQPVSTRLTYRCRFQIER